MPSVPKKKVLIAGASGLVGQAAMREFEHDLDWEVVGVSRRAPHSPGRATHVPLDLLDKERCAEVFGQPAEDVERLWRKWLGEQRAVWLIRRVFLPMGTLMSLILMALGLVILL